MSRAARLHPQDLEAGSAALLQQALEHGRTLTVGDVSLKISQEMRLALLELFKNLAAGRRVDVAAVDEMLTTQQAADLLRVSRPTLVKMLEAGALPYEKPGSHRKVSRAAVDAFLAARRERRAAALDAMTQADDYDQPDQIAQTR